MTATPASPEMRLLLALATCFLAVPLVRAQDVPLSFRDAFMGKFGYAGDRIVALAEAMPAETYSWRPGEGVMSVEEVYMHIARYNYFYPATSLGISPPEGIDLETMQDGIKGKEDVLAALRASVDHVATLVRAMDEEDLARPAELYGRQTRAWDVLFQLLTHMSEHLGQSIAYARTNGVVPPWSR